MGDVIKLNPSADDAFVMTFSEDEMNEREALIYFIKNDLGMDMAAIDGALQRLYAYEATIYNAGVSDGYQRAMREVDGIGD